MGHQRRNLDWVLQPVRSSHPSRYHARETHWSPSWFLALLSSLTLLFLTVSSRIGTPSMAAPLVSFLPLFAFPFLFQFLVFGCFLYLGFGFWIGLIWVAVTVNLWGLGSYIWFWFVVVGFVTMVVRRWFWSQRVVVGFIHQSFLVVGCLAVWVLVVVWDRVRRKEKFGLERRRERWES